MEVRGTIACFILLTTVPTIVISTNCTTTQANCSTARNTSNVTFADCCLNFTSTSATNLLPKSTAIPATISQIYIFANSNGSRPCLNNSDCSDEICLSVKCLTSSTSTSTEQCLCDRCGDGRCFNKTHFKTTTFLPPTSKAPQGITTFQIVLLFGSMGGIVVFICIVYCVKTFKDNRQRQYLLKHGVWDPPRDENKDSSEEAENDNKSQASLHDSKMEVPIIRVQMENEIDKSNESEIETVNEDDDVDDATEEIVRPKSGPTIQPDVIQVKGYTPVPVVAPSESPYHQNAKRNAPTKELSKEKTSPQGTIESTNANNIPDTWEKDPSKTPLTKSPIRKRSFPTLKKNKDSPKKIIANGTPEKSPKLTSKNRTATPPQLVEPENFSDFGM